MTTDGNKRYIIQGITQSGDKFRPSDWAERMCGNLCSFRNRRMIYSPLLRPAVIEGIKSVIVHHQLEQQHPNLFKEILDFAHKNQLKINEESIETIT
ncbi:DUF3579 domain-containing protein [Kangiella sp. TOML190]|uniref:DUF3579 domain-containing protein n=1 Tax=Kangiella sp. TOML190 TaxID=2931351 RepID=UPI0020422594|nr:DUF3579 domain-containing protein [Kangiella sp. TOML190]